MTDIVDQQTRSRMMAGIRGKNTKPELLLRQALHARGFRFRIHSSKVHGRPDIVLPKHRAVIFVHGCFWHRHEGCRYTTSPSTRPEFWQAKFEANVARDIAVRMALLADGWRVATVWECAVQKSTEMSETADLLYAWLHSGKTLLDVGGDSIQSAGLAVGFQQVVHSAPVGKAEVIEISVIPGGPNEHPQECPFDAAASRGNGPQRC